MSLSFRCMSLGEDTLAVPSRKLLGAGGLEKDQLAKWLLVTG